MTSRSSAWGDGTRSNVHESAEAIHESFRELVCQEHLYVSEDVTQGVDVDGLTVHADLLASIIKLDLLGGIVRQLDIEEAVQQLSEMPDVRAAFEAMAVAHRKQSKDLVVSLAFSLGVMLAHVRLKHSQFQRLKSCETVDRAWSHPEKLRALRALFDASWKPLSSPKTQPFLFFHDVSEEVCEDSDDFELLVPVTKVLTWSDDIVCGDHAHESRSRCHRQRVQQGSSFHQGNLSWRRDGGNVHSKPEGRFIFRPPSALPHKELAKQPEPKPKAQTKNKATPEVKAKLKAKPKGKAKQSLYRSRKDPRSWSLWNLPRRTSHLTWRWCVHFQKDLRSATWVLPNRSQKELLARRLPLEWS